MPITPVRGLAAAAPKKKADPYAPAYQPTDATSATSGPFGNYQNTPQPSQNLASVKQPYSMSVQTASPRDRSSSSYVGDMNPEWSQWLDQTAWAQEDAQNAQETPQSSPGPDYSTGYDMPTYNPFQASSSFGSSQPARWGGGMPTAAGWGQVPGAVATQPGMTAGGGPRYGMPNYYGSPLGNMVGNELYNPETGGFQRTGAQKGTNAGQALKALQEASGLNLLGSSSSAGSGASGAGGAGAAVPRVAPPDMSAARNAAFARAKDQSGQTARAAIDALRGTMAERGLLGSGIEGGRTAEIVGQAAGGLGEVSREQAIQDASAASQYGAMQYGGDITQRGQDLAAQQQRAQLEQQRQAQMLQGLLSVLPPGMLY